MTCLRPSWAEASSLNIVVLKSRADKKPISPHFRSTVEPLSASVCCLGPLSPSFSTEPHSPHLRLLTPPSLLTQTQTHPDICAHTHIHTYRCRQSYRCTHAHLGQRRRSERDRELWVTDLAKVAYGARPNHTRQIQFNNLPVHRERERERGREESLHFTEKAFVSSEYFTEMRERMRNRGFWVSFSPEIKDERGRKEKEKTEGEMRDECWPLLSYEVYFSHVYWLLITPTCLNIKAACTGTVTLSFPHMTKDSLTHTVIFSTHFLNNLLPHLFLHIFSHYSFFGLYAAHHDWSFQRFTSSLCLWILSPSRCFFRCFHQFNSLILSPVNSPTFTFSFIYYSFMRSLILLFI